jgi:hypothetical protein
MPGFILSKDFSGELSANNRKAPFNESHVFFARRRIFFSNYDSTLQIAWKTERRHIKECHCIFIALPYRCFNQKSMRIIAAKQPFPRDHPSLWGKIIQLPLTVRQFFGENIFYKY